MSLGAKLKGIFVGAGVAKDREIVLSSPGTDSSIGRGQG